jgi:hypothetical protein
VCMCVYVRVRVYVCENTYMFVALHVYNIARTLASMYVCACVCVSILIYSFVCTYACVHVCMYECMHAACSM